MMQLLMEEQLIFFLQRQEFAIRSTPIGEKVYYGIFANSWMHAARNGESRACFNICFQLRNIMLD